MELLVGTFLSIIIGAGFWIFFSVIAGVIANSKGRSGIGLFLLSIFLSPLIGIIVALIIQPYSPNTKTDKVDSNDLRKCPHCAELIKKEANLCRYCGKDVEPEEKQITKEPDKPSLPKKKSKKYLWIVIPWIIAFVFIIAKNTCQEEKPVTKTETVTKK